VLERHILSTTEWPTSCYCWRSAFAQKTFVADAPLSHKKHLLLTLRFRTKNICCWRSAFAQKTFVGLKPPADVTESERR